MPAFLKEKPFCRRSVSAVFLLQGWALLARRRTNDPRGEHSPPLHEAQKTTRGFLRFGLRNGLPPAAAAAPPTNRNREKTDRTKTPKLQQLYPEIRELQAAESDVFVTIAQPQPSGAMHTTKGKDNGRFMTICWLSGTLFAGFLIFLTIAHSVTEYYTYHSTIIKQNRQAFCGYFSSASRNFLLIISSFFFLRCIVARTAANQKIIVPSANTHY